MLSGGNRNHVTTNCASSRLRSVQLPGYVVPVYACANFNISCVCVGVALACAATCSCVKVQYSVKPSPGELASIGLHDTGDCGVCVCICKRSRTSVCIRINNILCATRFDFPQVFIITFYYISFISCKICLEPFFKISQYIENHLTKSALEHSVNSFTEIFFR